MAGDNFCFHPPHSPQPSLTLLQPHLPPAVPPHFRLCVCSTRCPEGLPLCLQDSLLITTPVSSHMSRPRGLPWTSSAITTAVSLPWLFLNTSVSVTEYIHKLTAYFSVSLIACNLQRTHGVNVNRKETSPAEKLQPCCHPQQVASQVNMSWGGHSGNLLDNQEICGHTAWAGQAFSHHHLRPDHHVRVHPPVTEG